MSQRDASLCPDGCGVAADASEGHYVWCSTLPVELRRKYYEDALASQPGGAREEGTTPDDCTACKGSGVFYEHHGPGLDEPISCDHCEGTGKAPAAALAARPDEWLAAVNKALTERQDVLLLAMKAGLDAGDGAVLRKAAQDFVSGALTSPDALAARPPRDEPQSEKEETTPDERVRKATSADALVKGLAVDFVQTLADSDPTDAAVDAMELLKGSPVESIFCVEAEELARVFECVVSDAIYDGKLAARPPQQEPSHEQVERVAKWLWNRLHSRGPLWQRVDDATRNVMLADAHDLVRLTLNTPPTFKEMTGAFPMLASPSDTSAGENAR